MKKEYNGELEKYRLSITPYDSCASDEFQGLFRIPFKFMPKGMRLKVLSSGVLCSKKIFLKEGDPIPSEIIGRKSLYDWEHVSVSLPNRIPTWREMDFIKDIFWGEDEAVIQIHPPKKDKINNHVYCLHLWKYMKFDLPMPMPIAVGLK